MMIGVGVMVKMMMDLVMLWVSVVAALFAMTLVPVHGQFCFSGMSGRSLRRA